MTLYKLQNMALALILSAGLGCGGPKPEQETEAAPPATVEQEEDAVFEEDFEAGDVDEWGETETPAAPGDEGSDSADDKE